MIASCLSGARRSGRPSLTTPLDVSWCPASLATTERRPGRGRHQLRDVWGDWVAAGKQVVVIADAPFLGRGRCRSAWRRPSLRDPCAAPPSLVEPPTRW